MECNIKPETFITKFDIKGSPFFAKIRICSKDESDLFTIQLFCNDYSWTGRFSLEEAVSFGKHLLEDIEEYSKNVVNVLKRNNNMYKFDFTQDEENVSKSKFIWKKTFADTTATSVHGFVTLERDEPTQNKDNILDFLIETNKSLQCKIQGLEQNNEILTKTVEKFTTELENSVNMKESLESTLYGKFVQILNSKKRRIKLLENCIYDIESVDN